MQKLVEIVRGGFLAVMLCGVVLLPLATTNNASAEPNALPPLTSPVSKVEQAEQADTKNAEAPGQLKKVSDDQNASDIARAAHNGVSAERFNLCENRKNAIQNKVTAFAAAADASYARLSTLLAGVEQFQADAKLPVDSMNYEVLTGVASDKQAAALVAANSLKALMPAGLDCTNNEAIQSLTGVKQAASDTRQALLDFRDATKNVIAVLKSTSDSSLSLGDAN